MRVIARRNGRVRYEARRTEDGGVRDKPVRVLLVQRQVWIQNPSSIKRLAMLTESRGGIDLISRPAGEHKDYASYILRGEKHYDGPIIPYPTNQCRWSRTTTSSITNLGSNFSPPLTVTIFNILGLPAVEHLSWLTARSVISLHMGPIARSSILDLSAKSSGPQ